MFAEALSRDASDIHVEQMPGTVSIRLRIAGNLVSLGELPDGQTTSILARLKALARLITYRTDIPQEGRLVLADGKLEARVGTLPTIHGERAVIRLSDRAAVEWLPSQLGMPPAIEQAFERALERPSGVILITGPAGSGKTTTAYAGLRYLLQHAREPRSLVSLEDPIESEIAGVSQSQIHVAAGYGWSQGLKALLRQDSEVMLVGEIRDGETAAVVFQAALTGQLVITSMHARSAADAVSRLLDMQVSAQHLRSALEMLFCQRLVRRNCACRQTAGGQAAPQQTDCPRCAGLGYHGRALLVEQLPTIDGELARALFRDADAGEIERICQSRGMQNLASLGAEMVQAGLIDAIQLKRYL